jgi:hypothetical protein
MSCSSLSVSASLTVPAGADAKRLMSHRQVHVADRNVAGRYELPSPGSSEIDVAQEWLAYRKASYISHCGLPLEKSDDRVAGGVQLFFSIGILRSNRGRCQRSLMCGD